MKTFFSIPHGRFDFIDPIGTIEEAEEEPVITKNSERVIDFVLFHRVLSAPEISKNMFVDSETRQNLIAHP